MSSEIIVEKYPLGLATQRPLVIQQKLLVGDDGLSQMTGSDLEIETVILDDWFEKCPWEGKTATGLQLEGTPNNNSHDLDHFTISPLPIKQ